MYRKKPISVNAYQMTPAHFESGDWPEWLLEAYNLGTLIEAAEAEAGIVIETLEGPLTVSWNDWIIQGVQGELYPCKPDIFAATYDEVE